MSTTTKNYGLVKPELTDAADITAMNVNWDKIDDELSVHNIKTYTSLEQIGIKSGTETIDSIVSALPLLSVLQIATSSANNMSIYPSVYGGTLRVEKSYGNRAKFTYFAQSYEWTGHYFNNTWYGWVNSTPSEYLPINGGGTVYADNLRPIVVKNTADNQCFTRYDGRDSVLGFIGFAGDKAPRILDKTGVILGDILHTGNKPSGQYIGNGSTAERTIQIGGNGDGLLITCGSGNRIMMFVTGYGAIYKNAADTTIQGLSWSDVMFTEGNLKIKGKYDVLNINGAVYYYQVL
jgi:hypothetical protein